ncbi:hypothetical protein K432DRAFT_391279 [Lepidopterella palustris CBS 459.81]|uniref:MARVEL domain-containing protein n=1 Tax=Lepidopterella palustris CBS 459.81 TaxID=1314670 RepID=A0A8E2JHE9_9PEZI|nr:hypothetical protein K432DRAFT_391279 [Lepidopterella palustris CBS 459.81]
MGAASKVTSVILRVMELISAVIVAALLGRFLYLLNLANAGSSSRIIYTEVIAGISIAFSILLSIPAKYSFYAFPIDFALFICWIVAFGLLANLTGSNACSSYWYWNTWGFYWGGYWRISPRPVVNASLIGSAGCAQWRCTLAWSFIGAFFWLISSLLGGYVIATYPERTTRVDAVDTLVDPFTSPELEKGQNTNVE